MMEGIKFVNKDTAWSLEGSIRGASLSSFTENNNHCLSSQLTGCCYTYKNYGVEDMCSLYGVNYEVGGSEQSSGDDEDKYSIEGLSFIGISFSVNTANGNLYLYQLCDLFAMEGIINCNYNYAMSMDKYGWLVGGGYKLFDSSGKIPYIDSSHTELLHVGSMDNKKGNTSIKQVYTAMEYLIFPPVAIFPEYVKGGGGNHLGDQDSGGTPSGNMTFIVLIMEEYKEDGNLAYNNFLDDLFDALEDVGSGNCMDDHDTDPHMSMSLGVKFHFL